MAFSLMERLHRSPSVFLASLLVACGTAEQTPEKQEITVATQAAPLVTNNGRCTPPPVHSAPLPADWDRSPAEPGISAASKQLQCRGMWVTDMFDETPTLSTSNKVRHESGSCVGDGDRLTPGTNCALTTEPHHNPNGVLRADPCIAEQEHREYLIKYFEHPGSTIVRSRVTPGPLEFAGWWDSGQLREIEDKDGAGTGRYRASIRRTCEVEIHFVMDTAPRQVFIEIQRDSAGNLANSKEAAWNAVGGDTFIEHNINPNETTYWYCSTGEWAPPYFRDVGYPESSIAASRVTVMENRYETLRDEGLTTPKRIVLPESSDILRIRNEGMEAIAEVMVLHAEAYAQELTSSTADLTLESIDRMYRDHDQSGFTCGKTLSDIPQSCASMNAQAWRMKRCVRMASDHVSTQAFDVANRQLWSNCFSLFTELGARDTSSCSADYDDYFDVLREVRDTILTRFFRNYTEQMQALNREIIVTTDDNMRQQLREERVNALTTYFALLNDVYEVMAQIKSGEELDAEVLRMVNFFFDAIATYRDNREALEDMLASNGEIDPTRPHESLLPWLPPNDEDGNPTYTLDGINSLDNGQAIIALAGAAVDQDILMAALGGFSGDPLNAHLLLPVYGEVLSGLSVDFLVYGHDVGCVINSWNQFVAPALNGTPATLPANENWPFGCKGQNGPQYTPLAKMYSMIAGLSAHTRLQDALNIDPSLDVNGWDATFDFILQHGQPLYDAIAQYGGNPATQQGDLSGVIFEALPPSVYRFFDNVSTARAHAETFDQRGLLRYGGGSRLLTGLTLDKRQQIIGAVTQRVAELRNRLDDYDVNVQNLLREFIDQNANQLRIDDVERAREEEILLLDEKLKVLYANLGALAKPNPFDDLMERVVEVGGIFNGFSYFTLPPSLILNPTADDAAFRSGQDDLTQFAIDLDGQGKMKHEVLANNVVSISASGLWAPDCAISRTGRYNSYSVSIGTGGRLTGSAGYTMSTSFSGANADTNWESSSHTRTEGENWSLCASGGLSLFGNGVVAQGCFTGAEEWTDASGDRTERSRTQSWDASFVSGIRLSGTPFPDAPAGSLVAVVMPKNQTSSRLYREIFVVRPPITSIPVSQDSDIYLVVNDIGGCVNRNTTDALTVTIQDVVDAETVAEALLTSVAEARDYIRNEAAGIVERRFLGAGERSRIATEARLVASSHKPEAGTPGLVANDYPPALQLIFDAMVQHELQRLEYLVRVTELSDEVDRSLRDLNGIERDLRTYRENSLYLSTIPAWSMRRLASNHMFYHATTLGDLTRHGLIPILDLWYPEVLEDAFALNSANQPVNPTVYNALQDLLNLTPTSSPRNAAGAILVASEFLANELDIASVWGSVTGRSPIKEVVVSFPRPQGANPSSPFPVIQTQFNKADMVRSNQVWTALDRWQTQFDEIAQQYNQGAITAQQANTLADNLSVRLPLQIVPEDIYASNGPSILSCSRQNPVVHRMAIGFVRNGAPTANCSANNVDYTSQGDVSPRQPFVGEMGIKEYTLDNPQWRNVETAVVYGTESTIKNEMIAALNGQSCGSSARSPNSGAEAEGVSPFTEFYFTLSGRTLGREFGLVPPRNGLGELNLPFQEATELVVLLEVESEGLRRAASLSPTIVPTCP